MSPPHTSPYEGVEFITFKLHPSFTLKEISTMPNYPEEKTVLSPLLVPPLPCHHHYIRDDDDRSPPSSNRHSKEEKDLNSSSDELVTLTNPMILSLIP